MPSSSSNSQLQLPWYLWPWALIIGPTDPLLNEGLTIQHPISPPPQMGMMPFHIVPLPNPSAQTLPSEIHTHIGQFLTDAQYANLVNQHIFTQAQHNIAINELSNQQLAYLLSRHVFTDEQLAYQLDHDLLTINQINMISSARLINIMSNFDISLLGIHAALFRGVVSSDINEVEIAAASLNQSQKISLLRLNFMSDAATTRFLSMLSYEEQSSYIINDVLTLRQIKCIERLSQISAEAVIHIINMDTDDKRFIRSLININVRRWAGAYDDPEDERGTQIAIALLVRMVESKKWDYYSDWKYNEDYITEGILSALYSRGIYLLTAVCLNKPQTSEDLESWEGFMMKLQKQQALATRNILNFVSIEAYTQWLDMVVYTSNPHNLFNINALSDERFLLINANFFLYQLPIEVTNFQSLPSVSNIYGFMAIVNGTHDFSSHLIYGSSINYLFDTMARLSRGRRDVLREVFKLLDEDKKALFVACTGYNPFTDDGLSLDSGGAGSSNDPPRPPGSSNDPPRPPGSSNDDLPHGGETRRLEQATPVLTPGLNYFGKELTLQPSEVKASVATKANLLPYDLVHNRLLNGNDHHWYRITLSKGSIYNFNMVKEGVSNLDANLVLRDTSGAVVATDTGLGGGHTQFLSVAGGRNALISFIAPYSGDYYLDASSAGVYVNSPNDMGNPSVGDFHGTGGYRLSSALVQKMALDVGAQAVDLIEVNTDRDWYQIHLNRGERYHFKLEHNPQDGLQPLLCLRDAQGNAILTSDSNGEFQFAPFASIDFTALQSGDYFLDVGSSHAASTGQYRLSSSRDDVLAVTTTRAKIVVGETIRGTLENNQDHDWYKVDLKAGITYKFFLKHVNNTDHIDPWLNLRNTNGKIIKSDDDSAGDLNSLIQFKATQNATYFLDAGSYHDQSRGQFSLSSVSVL